MNLSGSFVVMWKLLYLSIMVDKFLSNFAEH